jgi:hypothetical protein
VSESLLHLTFLRETVINFWDSIIPESKDFFASPANSENQITVSTVNEWVLLRGIQLTLVRRFQQLWL